MQPPARPQRADENAVQPIPARAVVATPRLFEQRPVNLNRGAVDEH